METYLYVFRGGQDMEKASPEDLQANMGKWEAWMGKLGQAGKLGGGEALLPQGRMVKSGGKVVTDGPFAEGSEVVGGYVIVTADSFDEAVELSQGCPILNWPNGTVEVRQIMKM